MQPSRRACDSGHSVWGEVSRIGGMKSNHDMTLGYTRLDELTDNFEVRAIVLHPDLAVPDVDVDDAAMYPAFGRPTDVEQFIVSVGVVEDGLYPHIRLL